MFDKAKRLAQEARSVAEGVGGALASAAAETGLTGPAGSTDQARPVPARSSPSTARERWEAIGLPDPGELLQRADLEGVGLADVVPEEVEDDYGPGLRWAADGRSVLLVHLLSQDAYEPGTRTDAMFELVLDVGDTTPVAGVGDEAFTVQDDDRGRLFVRRGHHAVAVAVEGLDPAWAPHLGRAAAARLPAGPPRITDPLEVLAHAGLPDPRTLLDPSTVLRELGAPTAPRLSGDDGVSALWQVGDRVLAVGWALDVEAYADGEEPSSPVDKVREQRRWFPQPAWTDGLGEEALAPFPGMLSVVVGERVLSVVRYDAQQPASEATMRSLAEEALRRAG